MKLRIVSGLLKGRTIHGPDKDLSFRPTLERTRQSIADMITPKCAAGALAADLCAGSGAFGFEMLSRGARRVDFVENDRKRADLIREHAEKFGVLSGCRILARDIIAFLRSSTEKYDIVFFDPPYDASHLNGLVPELMKTVAPGGVLLYQRRRLSGKESRGRNENDLPAETKTFGDTIVEIYKSTREE